MEGREAAEERIYAVIDLKSFYASVECIERGLDPLRACLVVADETRTDKTICLSVSPALKRYGVPGRPRLFEVKQIIQEVNAARRYRAKGRKLVGRSTDDVELQENTALAVEFLIASPQMAKYMDISRQIYAVYLRHFAPEDMHPYSIDEVFIDLQPYLFSAKETPHALIRRVIREVVRETGVTATAGIGTNLYLAKIAMDIVAKKMPADEDGVRIAELNMESYRRALWTHQPLTDFWRVGRGTARKLASKGIYTMGDVAATMLPDAPRHKDEKMLFRLLGVQAELLIDHAWGVETCTMSDIKSYRPKEASIVSGQVLQEAYTYEKTRIVVREMAEHVALDLQSKRLVTKQVVLTVGYDVKNCKAGMGYCGAVDIDRYGRSVPRHAHGTENLPDFTARTRDIIEYVTMLYDRIVNRDLFVRRLSVAAMHLKTCVEVQAAPQEVELFSEEMDLGARRKEREQSIEDAVLAIKERFGMNAVLRGSNLLEGAMQRERNRQIGGHKA